MGISTGRESMFRLIFKDFRIGRLYLWIVLPLYAAYGAMFYVSVRMYLYASAIYLLFLTIGPVLLESRFKTDLLYCSLPLSRSSIVLGRYINSVMVILTGTMVCIAYGLLLNSLAPESQSFSLFFALREIGPFILFIFLALSLFYPFYFRFGLGKGIYGFVFALLAVVVLFVGIDSLIWLSTHGNLGGYSPLITGQNIAGRLVGSSNSIILLVAVTVLYAVSYILSAQGYKKRDF